MPVIKTPSARRGSSPVDASTGTNALSSSSARNLVIKTATSQRPPAMNQRRHGYLARSGEFANLVIFDHLHRPQPTLCRPAATPRPSRAVQPRNSAHTPPYTPTTRSTAQNVRVPPRWPRAAPCTPAPRDLIALARRRRIARLPKRDERLYAPFRTRTPSRAAIGAQKIRTSAADFMGARPNSAVLRPPRPCPAPQRPTA
ncbi:hypothetical protein VTO73DRAFT_9976 [Trametes versicolor]